MLILAFALACADPATPAPATTVSPTAAPTGPTPALGPTPPPTASGAPTATPVAIGAVPAGDAMPSTWEVRGPHGGSHLQLWPKGTGVSLRLVGGTHDYAGAESAAPGACVLALDGARGDTALALGGPDSARVTVNFHGRTSATVTATPGAACPDGVSFDGPYTRLGPTRDPLALCRPGEAPWFACITEKGDHAALCGSTDPETAGATLQYRFGHPGDVRLAWPAGGAAPESHFRLKHATHARSTSVSVMFENEGYAFNIWSQAGGDDDDGAGVTVEQGNTQVGAHVCAGEISVDRLDDLSGLLKEE